MDRLYIVAFIYLVMGCEGQSISRINKRLRVVGEKGAAIQSTAKSIYDIIQDMYVQLYGDMGDTCSIGVDTVMDSLGDLEEKIEKLEANGGGNSVVSAFTSIIVGNDSSVQVSVGQAFRDCMSYWKLDEVNNAAKIWCLRVALWQFVIPEDRGDSTRKRRSAVEGRALDEIYMDLDDPTNPPTGFRVRREYRTLTQTELVDYHSALKVLYDEGVVEKFAETHKCAMNDIHVGRAFLPWHRAFITFFEEALRKVNGKVFLPYWDSNLDRNFEELPDGTTRVGSAYASSLFSRQLMGTALGNVTTGPAAGWKTGPREIPLKRDVAQRQGAKLMSQRKLDNMMTLCDYESMARALENQHNRVHRWVSGTMSSGRSPYDPLFYMHHAYIDYLWQQFREHQRKDCLNVDPTLPYEPMPFNGNNKTDKSGHDPFKIMSQMKQLKNEDGLKAYWVEESWYNYAPPPHCPDCGGNPSFLKCDNKTNECVAVMRFQFRDTRQRMVQNAVQAEADAKALFLRRFGKSRPVSKNETHPSHLSTSEIAARMCSGEIPLTKYAGKLAVRLDNEREHAIKSPPLTDPDFFGSLPQWGEEPRCRSPQSLVYDCLTAEERGVDVSLFATRVVQ